ncbi:starvation-inducible DNA-binding protein [Natronincola peptidivorans]|uniref:Starvation-inducible DNA-binding protein n=1 Tax=Natronincola peptidivorans TaxID=426128 RepID=A0A1I0BQL2_9FIRM|nr:DNA starvation/stationary phase protection protein [Natronincola peptidivorans]SET09317.1 starvation-inducible DNA-binding protein [Natronincola peptidivorans]
MKDYTKLNEYLSNLAVLNVKLHNLHWNVVGKQFIQVHEFTESMYNDFFEKYDDVAELMKTRDEQPLAKMADYLKNTSIKELDKDKFTSTEVLEIVQDDLNKMKDLATEIRTAADEAGDFGIVAEFEDHIAGYSKNLWFIKSMLA